MEPQPARSVPEAMRRSGSSSAQLILPAESEVRLDGVEVRAPGVNDTVLNSAHVRFASDRIDSLPHVSFVVRTNLFRIDLNRFARLHVDKLGDVMCGEMQFVGINDVKQQYLELPMHKLAQRLVERRRIVVEEVGNDDEAPASLENADALRDRLGQAGAPR